MDDNRTECTNMGMDLFLGRFCFRYADMAFGEDCGETTMILLTIAIVFSALLLSVEIPAFIRMHEEEDFLLCVMSGLMLLCCVTVLFFWRGV